MMRFSTFSQHSPLAGHEAFRAQRLDVLCDQVETRLRAKCIRAVASSTVNAVANRYYLPSGELWFCDYGTPISLAFEEGDYLRLQFQIAGAGATRIGHDSYAVTSDEACISYAPATIDFAAGFKQLVWRVRRDVLVRKFAALTGVSVAGNLEFNRVLRLDTPAAAGLTALLDCMLVTIAGGATQVTQLVMPELEQALIVSLLCTSKHDLSDALLSIPSAALPWQVRLVEEYLEANLDKPFDLERIAATAGTSARSIYRAFNKSRGYSPAEFVRRRRLVRAAELLRHGDMSQTITSIAFTCGFGDVSRFSKDFAATFGEPPSIFRSRRK